VSIEKIDDWLSYLLPRRCVLCHAPSGRQNVCVGCHGDLPWICRACKYCGATLSPNSDADSCVQCPIILNGIQRAFSALAYEYPVDKLVTAAKFSGRIDIARALGELLTSALISSALPVFLPRRLIAMPLHASRLGRRGYNQAAEIALPVSRALRIPLAQSVCQRVRNTPEQTSLTGAARRQNMCGAFRVRRSMATLDVALIDDVVTTGSTASELAGKLLDAGARSVQLWTVAAARKV